MGDILQNIASIMFFLIASHSVCSAVLDLSQTFQCLNKSVVQMRSLDGNQSVWWSCVVRSIDAPCAATHVPSMPFFGGHNVPLEDVAVF